MLLLSYKSISQDDPTINCFVAQARALRIAIIHKAISYEGAKVKAEDTKRLNPQTCKWNEIKKLCYGTPTVLAI